MEFCSKKFEEEFRRSGIKVERTNTYSPEMNGVAERYNRTALDGVRAILEDAKLPAALWAEILMTFTYLFNRFIHNMTGMKTPQELWSNRRPSVKHLRRIGCKSFVHIHKLHRNKLQNRSRRGILVGYALKTKGYRIWFPDTDELEETKHVVFDENSLGIDKQRQDLTQSFYPFIEEEQPDEEINQEETNQEETEVNQETSREPEVEWKRVAKTRSQGASAGRVDVYYFSDQKPGLRLRSMNDVKKFCSQEGIIFDSSKFNFSSKDKAAPISNLDVIEESEDETQESSTEQASTSSSTEFTAAMCIEVPTTYEEALMSPYKYEWTKAMEKEMSTMQERDVWDIVPCPRDQKVIGCKWVYAVKKDS